MWSVWLCCSLCLVSAHQHHRNAAGGARLGQLRFVGVMPFEADVLPYAVIERIYEQQNARAQRQLPRIGHNSKPKAWQSAKLSAIIRNAPSNRIRKLRRPQFFKSLRPTRKSSQTMSDQPPQLRLERSRKNSKLFNLYDADGDHLLDLSLHVERPAPSVKIFIPIGNGPKVEWMAPTVANTTFTTTTRAAVTTTSETTAMGKQWQRKPQSPSNAAEKLEQHFWLHL